MVAKAKAKNRHRPVASADQSDLGQAGQPITQRLLRPSISQLVAQTDFHFVFPCVPCLPWCLFNHGTHGVHGENLVSAVSEGTYHGEESFSWYWDARLPIQRPCGDSCPRRSALAASPEPPRASYPGCFTSQSYLGQPGQPVLQWLFGAAVLRFRVQDTRRFFIPDGTRCCVRCRAHAAFFPSAFRGTFPGPIGSHS